MLVTPAACSPSDVAREPTIKVAFLQDLSVPDHEDLVSPSFLAFDTMIQRRVVAAEGPAVEVVQLDTGGSTSVALEMARDVAADPSFVVAVVAPFWEEPLEVARELARAGVPTLSLSPESGSPWLEAEPPPGDPAELWRRFVPDRETEARVLAAAAERASSGALEKSVCVVSDGSGYASDLTIGIEGSLATASATVVDGADPERSADEARSTGCDVVVWAGFPPEALEFAGAMRDGEPTRAIPIDLAGAALKTAVPPVADDGDGVVGSAACPCADVTVSLDLASRRFVNLYQSEHGLPPGIFAAEAWDAGGIVAGAISSGTATRAEMRSVLEALTDYAGVARTYEFDPVGEPIGADAALFRAAGTRWLPVGR